MNSVHHWGWTMDSDNKRERLLITQLARISAVIDAADLLDYNDYVKNSAFKIFYEYKRQLSLEIAKGQSESISTWRSSLLQRQHLSC